MFTIEILVALPLRNFLAFVRILLQRSFFVESSVTFSNSRSNLVANKFQVFAQVSLARQQNINCLQLAEFPPLGCSRGQSGAGSAEQSRLAVATAPLRLVCTLHTLLAAFVRWLKITRQSEAQLAAAAAAVWGVMRQMSSFGMFLILFSGRNLPTIKREREGTNIWDQELRLSQRWRAQSGRAGERGLGRGGVLRLQQMLVGSLVISELQHRCGEYSSRQVWVELSV